MSNKKPIPPALGHLAARLAAHLLLPVLPLAFAVFLGAGTVHAAPTSAAAEKATPEALAAQLSDDSYQVREDAMQVLWSMGEKALPALRRIAGSDDPEASSRARELVFNISAGLLPDSPEKIKALVRQFARSDKDGKIVILRKLANHGHWRQVLHLAKHEKDPATRAQMSAIVRKVTTRATRDAIVQGKLDLATEILELTATDPHSQLMRAWIAKCSGKLDQQLREAKKIPGKKGAMWRLALHRTSGNIPAAIREARKAGLPVFADALTILDGNPRPWLRRQSQQTGADTIYGTACRIQLLRLADKPRKAGHLARKLASMGRDQDTAARAATSLAANGYREQALALIRRHDPDAAFFHYHVAGFPQLSLEVLGIPADAKPPYTAWVKEFTAHAIDEEDDALYRRLVMLASFLVAHGESEHALAVLTPVMQALEADGSDDWFELLPFMVDSGLGAQAIHFLAQRGNEDGEADLGVKKILPRISSKYREHIWTKLKKRNPDDIGKALTELALLSGLVADPENKTAALHKALADEAAGAAANKKLTHLSALFAFAVERHDLATASRMADTLARDNDRWVSSKTRLDTALMRWEKAEPGLAAAAKKNPGSDTALTQWYIALSKLGRKQQAKETYQRALLLSMGDPWILISIGRLLHSSGMKDEATDLWLQAAAVADPAAAGFDSAILHLASYGQGLRSENKWRIAASISEVSANMAMRGRSNNTLQATLRLRFNADFCHGMALLKQGKKSAAIATLATAQQLIPGDGLLADEFFPTLRKYKLGTPYNQWFGQNYRHLDAVCKLYPRAHNAHNTAAWLAARARRKLNAAHAHAVAALSQRPAQCAYLDTMAEIWFARGNRAKAVEWSEKALAASISHAHGTPRRYVRVIESYREIHGQRQRFQNDPLPNK